MLPQRLALTVHKYDALTPIRVSSSRSYDRALGEIFPYHTKISHEEGQELSGILSRGLKHGPNLEYEYFPSFALMMDFTKTEGGKGRKVLWMSESSLSLLKAHDDLYEIILKDHTSPRTWTD